MRGYSEWIGATSLRWIGSRSDDLGRRQQEKVGWLPAGQVTTAWLVTAGACRACIGDLAHFSMRLVSDEKGLIENV